MISTFEFISTWLKARFTDTDRGASLVEYALLVALIAVVCIGALQLLGGEAEKGFSNVASEIGDATVTP